MKKPLIILFLIINFSVSGIAGTLPSPQAEKDFQEANSYYEKGYYDNAIKVYKRILDYGLNSAKIYYNLGNCYFKKGALGNAILYYEKARRLKPRDMDVVFNQEYAKATIKQKVMPGRMWLIDRLDWVFSFFSLKEMIFTASAIYYLIIVCAIIFVIFKKIRRQAAYAAGILLIIFLISFFPLSRKIGDSYQGAIVISAIADTKFGPFADAAASFPLYEGTKIYVLGKKGDWCKIKRIDGEIGWTRKGNIALIRM